jgi:hypothetical protein
MKNLKSIADKMISKKNSVVATESTFGETKIPAVECKVYKTGNKLEGIWYFFLYHNRPAVYVVGGGGMFFVKMGIKKGFYAHKIVYKFGNRFIDNNI